MYVGIFALISLSLINILELDMSYAVVSKSVVSSRMLSTEVACSRKSDNINLLRGGKRRCSDGIMCFPTTRQSNPKHSNEVLMFSYDNCNMKRKNRRAFEARF